MPDEKIVITDDVAMINKDGLRIAVRKELKGGGKALTLYYTDGREYEIIYFNAETRDRMFEKLK